MSTVLAPELRPFPSSCAQAAEGVVSDVARLADMPPQTAFDVWVNGEPLVIPGRVYCDASAFRAAHADAGQRPFVDCLLTRHHDGYERMAALRDVLGVNQPWTMPYVVQLLGEYVVEIIKLIETSFSRIDARLLRDYLLENPEHLRLTRARVASYWDCYYRQGIKRDDYAGFKVLARIDRLLADR